MKLVKISLFALAMGLVVTSCDSANSGKTEGAATATPATTTAAAPATTAAPDTMTAGAAKPAADTAKSAAKMEKK